MLDCYKRENLCGAQRYIRRHATSRLDVELCARDGAATAIAIPNEVERCLFAVSPHCTCSPRSLYNESCPRLTDTPDGDKILATCTETSKQFSDRILDYDPPSTCILQTLIRDERIGLGAPLRPLG
jgi:hypothetical protein